ILRVGQSEFLFQQRSQCRKSGTVQDIDRRREREYRQHQPAVGRGVVRGHWNSMVATSPAVASLALAFGKYATLILRGFCTPHPSDTSPLPVYTTFDGSATSSFTTLCDASSMNRRACSLGRQSTCLSVPE